MEPLLTVEELAELLQVARIFVYRHAAEIGAVKVGRHLRFSTQAVQTWLEASRLVEEESHCRPDVENELVNRLKQKARTRRAS
ncbi:MAG: helix-turn-helix domain-containing protein [Acidobacteria bacterium]|nr:helix-turn-helix domain-containing protein [Acidobacteriota bacterium]